MEEAKIADKYDVMAKIIVIGDSGVGKTNFITRFCENSFKDSYVATIGVDFKVKTITVDEKRYKLQIWDTAGQQRFKNITQTYYKGAAGICLTYSIIDRTSFENIEKWMIQIENNAPKQVSKILLATKCDLEDSRQISKQQGQALAKKHGLNFIEISSKSGTNIKQSFQILVKCMNQNMKSIQNQKIPVRREIMLNKKQMQQNKKCNC